jgi:peptide chain release factor 1
MLPSRDELEAESRELAAQLALPETTQDPALLGRVSKRYKEVEDTLRTVVARDEAVAKLAALEAEKPQLDDPELVELADQDIAHQTQVRDQLTAELEEISRPRDPNDDRPAMIEIRAGAGGDEASLFAGDLYGMYHRYAESRGWPVEVFSQSASEAGGYKEIVFRVGGDGAFGSLKFEGGTHRVQRVPSTESSGRIHTSTATVAVLPEAEEVDVAIAPADVRVDVFRSSGPGGQSVNTTDSAVRLTHLPTGITVSCQDEKSQHKNKAKAMTILRTRLKEQMEAEAAQERGDTRRAQVGTGERSEKIRTYNFPQDRITDHRIGYTTHGIPKLLAGELQPLIDALTAAARTDDA